MNAKEPLSADEMHRMWHNLPISHNGSKQRMFAWLAEILSDEAVDCRRAIDGFSGSGIISAWLANMGLTVYSSDQLMSSYCLTSTLASNPGEILGAAEMNLLTSHRAINGQIYEDGEWVEMSMEIPEVYRGVLTDNEVMWLTRTREKAVSLSAHQRLMVLTILRSLACIQPFGTPQGRSTFPHRIKQKDKYGNQCLGHYLNSSYEIELETWFKKYANKFNGAVEKLADRRVGRAISFRMDVMDLLKMVGPVDLAYFDPPYGNLTSRSYSEDYALHEEVMGAEPIEVSSFHSPDNHGENFRGLLNACQSIPSVIFSYNDQAWASIDDICEQIEDAGWQTVVHSMEYQHGRTTIKNSQNRAIENVIVGRKRGHMT